MSLFTFIHLAEINHPLSSSKSNLYNRYSNIWQIHLTVWEQVVWTHTNVGVFFCGWYENPVFPHPLTFALPCSALWVILQCPCQKSGCVNGAVSIRLWHLYVFANPCPCLPSEALLLLLVLSFSSVSGPYNLHPYYFFPQVLVVGQDLVGVGTGGSSFAFSSTSKPTGGSLSAGTYILYLPPFIPRPPEMTESEQTSLVYLLSCYISLSICHLEEIGHASYIN